MSCHGRAGITWLRCGWTHDETQWDILERIILTTKCLSRAKLSWTCRFSETHSFVVAPWRLCPGLWPWQLWVERGWREEETLFFLLYLLISECEAKGTRNIMKMLQLEMLNFVLRFHVQFSRENPDEISVAVNAWERFQSYLMNSWPPETLVMTAVHFKRQQTPLKSFPLQH